MPFENEWVDSFDSYGAGSGTDLATEAYSATQGSLSFVAGRTGNALRMNGGGGAMYVEKTLSGAMSRIKIGFAWSIASSLNEVLITFLDGSTVQATIVLASSTSYQLFRGDRLTGTSLGTFTIPTVSTGTFYHIEIDITFNDSTGTCTVYHNGVLAGTLSSIDTNNGGGNQITKFWLGSNDAVTNQNVDYDDLIVQPSSGTFPLGPLQVHYLTPSAAGSANELDSNLGAGDSNNFQKVDEVPANADTDYVQSATPGLRDLYALSNLTPTQGSIKGVVVRSQTKLDVAGSQTLIHTLKTNSTEYDGTSKAPSTSYSTYQSAWAVNPNTGNPWTIAEINALEAGVQIG